MPVETGIGKRTTRKMRTSQRIAYYQSGGSLEPIPLEMMKFDLIAVVVVQDALRVSRQLQNQRQGQESGVRGLDQQSGRRRQQQMQRAVIRGTLPIFFGQMG